MSQQRDFAVTFVVEVECLSHNALRVPAAFAAPGKRHHAKAAHVVAAPHDGNESRDPLVVQAHGLDLRVRLFPAQQRIDRFLSALHFVHEAGQIAVGIWPHHHVYQFLLLQQLIAQALGHAPQDAHFELWILALSPFQVLQSVADALLSIVPNRAGIEQNQIGLLFALRGGKARFCEDAGHNLAVAKVHLTTVAL